MEDFEWTKEIEKLDAVDTLNINYDDNCNDHHHQLQDIVLVKAPHIPKLDLEELQEIQREGISNIGAVLPYEDLLKRGLNKRLAGVFPQFNSLLLTPKGFKIGMVKYTTLFRILIQFPDFANQVVIVQLRKANGEVCQNIEVVLDEEGRLVLEWPGRKSKEGYSDKKRKNRGSQFKYHFTVKEALPCSFVKSQKNCQLYYFVLQSRNHYLASSDPFVVSSGRCRINESSSLMKRRRISQ